MHDVMVVPLNRHLEDKPFVSVEGALQYNK